MKRITIVMFCILMVLECTSCQKTDNTKMASHNNPQYNFPATFEKEVENVIFNTELSVNDEVMKNGLYKTTALPQKMNSKKAYDILFEGIEVKETIEMVPGKEMQYLGINGENLYMVKDYVTFSTDFSGYVLHTFKLEGEDYNADQYLTGEEFSFMSIEEAYENLVKTVSGFGMDISGNYNCYSLDYIKMEENEYAINYKGKEDTDSYKESWTEDDNCYFFAVHQLLQGCIVQFPIAEVFREVCDANAPVQALYTKYGLERLDIYELFTFKQSKEPLLLKDFEEIADMIANKYNMILSDSKYEITEAELFWRPMETENEVYEMIPAWEVTILEVSTERTLHMYVNAVTAEEIL